MATVSPKGGRWLLSHLGGKMATVSPRGTSCWKTFDDGWHEVCSVCLGIPSLVEPA